MADTSTGDKTEKASQQKLKKSRQEGQVVRSRDLASAIGILVSLKLFVWLLPGYYADFLEIFHESFAPFDSRGALDNAQSMLFSNAMWLLIKMVLPLFVVPLFVVLGAMVPGGWVISTSHWAPKMERLSPSANLGRLFTAKHAFEFAISGAQCEVLMPQPPGTIAPSTTNSGTTNSGSTILISSHMALLKSMDWALSSAPRLSKGAKLSWKISRKSA